MKVKAVICDKIGVERAVSRISHEIVEHNKGAEDLCLIGILTRGVPLAEKIRGYIKEFEGAELPVGSIDITLYRDDLSELFETPKVAATKVDFDVKGKNVVLCDDVLFTGRTVRAAIDAVMKLGRPKTIQLAVLIDRGHRELPIRADYVGKNVPTSIEEVVEVRFEETDGEQSVQIDAID